MQRKGKALLAIFGDKRGGADGRQREQQKIISEPQALALWEQEGKGQNLAKLGRKC